MTEKELKQFAKNDLPSLNRELALVLLREKEFSFFKQLRQMVHQCLVLKLIDKVDMNVLRFCYTWPHEVYHPMELEKMFK